MEGTIKKTEDRELMEKSIRFEQEAMYMVTIKHVKKMYKDGLISREEFDKLNKVYIEKYHPGLPVLADD